MRRVVWWLEHRTVDRENGGLCSYVCMRRVVWWLDQGTVD